MHTTYQDQLLYRFGVIPTTLYHKEPVNFPMAWDQNLFQALFQPLDVRIKYKENKELSASTTTCTVGCHNLIHTLDWASKLYLVAHYLL
jgi:hypothetical protein